MGWAYALMALMAALLAFCIWIVARDGKNRGRRIKYGRLHRERITPSIPTPWMRDFKSRK